MGGDTKTEPGPSPKVEARGLPDEVRAEVESLVQAALAKMQEANFNYSVAKTVLPVAEISTTSTETELERRYKEIVSTLEAKLSDSNKQLQTAYRDLGDARDQLEKQRAKSVQLEQRILQMSEAEGTFKSTLAVLRAEKDKALAREREALMARDRAGAHNAHLSNQLSELQSSLDLKVAELNDITYIRRQLENRINELNRENMSLRQAKPSKGASTGAQAQSGGAIGAGTNTQPMQPPSNLYFSMPARRHTVPNLYPPAAPTAPAASTSPTAPRPSNSLSPNRPPKRARADSDVSEGAESTHSGVSSGSSMTFTLRPVKPEPAQSAQPTPIPIVPSSNTSHPRYLAYSPVSPIAPVPPYYTPQQQQQPGAYAAPIPYQNQRSYQTQASVPQKSSSASPTMATAPPAMNATAPTMVSTPAQMMQHAPVQRIPSVQQFINQMFFYTPTGFPECKICKARLLGAPNGNGPSTPPTVTDLLAHADQYHGKALIPNLPQQQQT